MTLTWGRHGAETDLTTENGLGAAFAKKNPGVTVKPLILPFADYQTKIPVLVAGGTAPDVFGAFPTLLSQVYDAKGVVPVNDYVKADATINYADFVFPGDGQFDGKIVGLPQKSCTHQLRFNKKLFTDAGLPTPADLFLKDKEKSWNWASFLDMAPKLTKGTDQFFFIGGEDNTFYLPLIRSNGGDIIDAAQTKCTITDPPAIEALQWMADLVLKYKVEPPPQMKADQLGINFQTGKLATAMGTTCDSVRDLRQGSELPFAWDFIVIPAGKAGFRAWGDTDQMVTAASAKNPDMAYKWMVYRSSKDAWEEMYAQSIFLAFSDGPTRLSIFDSKSFTEPLKALNIDLIKAGYTATIPTPFTPRTPLMGKILNDVVTVEIDNMLRGTKSVDQTASDIASKVNAMLKAA
jgi:ABC-type glycerol-3-phosphate transport system substrate-binding protein